MPQTSWQTNCCSMWGWYGELREWKTGENVVIWWQPQLDLCFSPWVPTWSDMKGGLFRFYVREELKIPAIAPLPLQIIDQTASVGCCCVEIVTGISGSLKPEIITWCMLGFFLLKHKISISDYWTFVQMFVCVRRARLWSDPVHW